MHCERINLAEKEQPYSFVFETRDEANGFISDVDLYGEFSVTAWRRYPASQRVVVTVSFTLNLPEMIELSNFYGGRQYGCNVAVDSNNRRGWLE